MRAYACCCLKFNWNIGVFLEVPCMLTYRMKILETTLVVLFLVAGCAGDEEDDSVQADPTFNDARISVFEAVEEGAARTINNGVSRFTSTGSILRSSKPDDVISLSFHASPGEITNTVSTSIERANPTVKYTVSGSGGDSLSFDSATQAITETIRKRALPPSPLRRHHLEAWSLFDYSESETSASTVAATWHNEYPTDYLAAGYYMRLKGDLATESIENVDVGVFVDSPAFLSKTPELPTEGIAFYRGRFAGIYMVYFGPLPQWQQIDYRLVNGFKEAGEVSSEIVLKVDFANKTIEGCIGCVENLETTGLTLHPDGTRSELYTKISLASISLAPAQINPESTRFEHSKLTVFVRGPKLEYRFNLGETRGSWDGKFSNHPAGDKSGHPGLVAGTTGAQFRLPDGTRGVYVGSFFATKLITQP